MIELTPVNVAVRSTLGYLLIESQVITYRVSNKFSVPWLRRGRVLRVAIVSETRLYREALAQTIEQHAAVAEADAISPTADRDETMRGYMPDLVLVDMAGTESLKFVGAAYRRWPDVKLIALGVRDTEIDVVACARLGIQGLVMRDASFEELFNTIDSTMLGQFCWSARATATLVRHVASTAADLNGRKEPGCRAGGGAETRDDPNGRPSDSGVTGGRDHKQTEGAAPGPDTPLEGLTARQNQILQCLSAGLSNKEIARELGIEVPTVKHHVHKVLKKLGVQRRSAAAAHVFRHRTELAGPVSEGAG